MVEVHSAPIRDIVILHKVQYSLDDFLRALGMASGYGVAWWAEGVVFSYSTLPWSDLTIKEAIDGRVYWSNVAYAELPIYQPLLESKDRRIKIGVIDVTSSETLREAARWLRVLERLPRAWRERKPRIVEKSPLT
jgi:hypothetical protein